MSKEHKPLKFFLKWSYDEPKHPEKALPKFTWDSGIEMTIDGSRLMFDNDTTVNEWRVSEIEKWENLMKNFNKDKKVMSLDVLVNSTEDEAKEVMGDKNFIKWV